MLYNTRKERDLAIVAFYDRCIERGLSKTQATEEARNEFKFLTPIPIYSARRRVREQKEAANG